MLPFTPSAIVMVPESVVWLVDNTKSVAPFVLTGPDTNNFPVPLFKIEISPLTPSAIVIDPESDPAFVLMMMSAAPLLVMVAFAPESPTLTVSASRFTFPVPLGVNVISVLVVNPVMV